MKNFILLLPFLLFNTFLRSQNACLSGKITRENEGGGLANVMVILNSKVIKNTDASGNFQFDKLPVGQHHLSVLLLGYEKKEITVAVVSENEIINLPLIELKENAIQINEVIITESPSSYSTRYQGSNVIVSSKDIELSKPIGTEEILKKVSGLNVSGDMGISNRLNVGIRGSYPRRSVNILLMEDGVPIAPAPYLAPEAYYNPPA
ncbi:MAG: carboxypeptidase-like regulatory domain-containing protein, partial [Bacteroidia bacterium]|nr:carboxypeptidase-like regulatory domain-containing protein [Bacteroidia bacterium]